MSTLPRPYLAEVAEAEASGETRYIYEEIRRLTGVPFVALIYRHLATIPQALVSVWQAVAPLMESGELQECAWAVARDAWIGPGADLPADVLALGDEQLARIADVIHAYNRANPVNLGIVCVIRDAASRTTWASGSAARAPWTPPPMIRSLPALRALDELSPELRARVAAFAKPGSDGTPVLVPTLYRHLAHWPPFLSLAQREVEARVATPAFQEAADRFRIAMQEKVKLFSLSSSSTGEILKGLTPLLDRFSGVIPEMVIVGNFLSRTLAK